MVSAILYCRDNFHGFIEGEPRNSNLMLNFVHRSISNTQVSQGIPMNNDTHLSYIEQM